MTELPLLISSLLLVISLGIIFVYFKKMREISKVYFEAKNVLSDIILSFKMDLQKQENRIRSISQTVERLPLGDKASGSLEQIRDELEHIKDELKEASNVKVEVSAKIEELRKKVERLMSQQEESMKKMMKLEAFRPKGPLMTDRIQGVIPIRKEKALASLTGTELRVLEILSAEGEKTASQIRDKIKLTREHTARLMKSLYTRGYVERRTDRLPYVYRIKNEMLKILKKKGARSEPT